MMFSEIVQKEAQEMREEGRAEGRAEALKENRIETAKNMLDRNLDVQLISECTSLPLEQVLALQKELSAHAAD